MDRRITHGVKKFMRPLVAVLAVLFALTTLGGVVFSRQGASPHERGGDCKSCHLNDPESAHGKGEKLLFVSDVDRLCRRCHDMKPGLSHPSGVMVDRPLPEAFPLDWAGRLICTSCHYPHRENHPDVTGYMLRTEKIARPLCEQCHDNLRSALGGKHSGVMSRSHLGGNGLGVVSRSFIDETSLQCLGCHDGTVAKTQMSRVGGGGGGAWQHSQIGLSHPIGVDYPPRGKGKSRYRPVAQIDPRIQLFNGKMGCCSCHEAYSNEKHGLVMSNEGSALCFECHDM